MSCVYLPGDCSQLNSTGSKPCLSYLFHYLIPIGKPSHFFFLDLAILTPTPLLILAFGSLPY